MARQMPSKWPVQALCWPTSSAAWRRISSCVRWERCRFITLQPVHSRYAQENLGPLAGFITGWTYCFEILIVAIADVTAFGIYMGVWFPAVPHWIWVLSVVLIICAVNLMSVKVFGELEFWFSFFKVATIIIMIVAGFGIIIWGSVTAASQPVFITSGATVVSSATAGSAW